MVIDEIHELLSEFLGLRGRGMGQEYGEFIAPDTGEDVR